MQTNQFLIPYYGSLYKKRGIFLLTKNVPCVFNVYGMIESANIRPHTEYDI